MTKGIRYETASAVQVSPWVVQGTIYAKQEDARFAALKLFCNTTGVLVKRVADGWTLLFWRQNTLAA